MSLTSSPSLITSVLALAFPLLLEKAPEPPEAAATADDPLYAHHAFAPSSVEWAEVRVGDGLLDTDESVEDGDDNKADGDGDKDEEEGGDAGTTGVFSSRLADAPSLTAPPLAVVAPPPLDVVINPRKAGGAAPS